GKANAMNTGSLGALGDALDQAQATAKAVILTGRDGVFSGGFDLKVMKETPEAVPALVEAGGRMALRLFTYPRPLVLAATGHAIALGAVFLCCADVRIGRVGPYKVGLNETAISMVLPNFAREVALYRLPKAKVDEAVLQAQIYPHEEGLGVGYFDALDEDPVGAALKKAEALAQLPTETFAAQKLALRKEVIASIEAKIV
ncbi:MAG: crotonase/enoyl-CoA hydratase family protein, partial [Myxococcota bacterium]